MVDKSFTDKIILDHETRLLQIKSLEKRLDTDSGGASTAVLRLMLEALTKKRERHYEALTYVAKTGLGSILMDSNKSSYALMMADVSAGGFRSQIFNADGFIGHSSHRSLYEATVDAVNKGYYLPDTEGAGRLLMKTARFEKGNTQLSVVQAVNSKILTMDQAHNRLAEIDHQYQARF